MGLIVNADDFGKSEEVNKAIAECFEKGYIDRTTVMMNMPYAPAARDLAKEKGFLDRVGIHLNLTEGRPLTEGISKNPLFCDENGEFNAAFYRSTKLRLHMDSNSVKEIYDELKAQLDKYVELGFTLNHVDSHHHVHTNLPVLKALKRLSKEYKLSSVRLSRNLYTGGSFLQRVYKDYYNKCVKKICEGTTDFFGSFKDAEEYLSTQFNKDKGAFKRYLSDLTLEIMVHPMYTEESVLVDTDIPFIEENSLYEAIR